MPARVVVPYTATNSTVRARALRWIERTGVEAVVYGPGFATEPVPAGDPSFLVRNVRAMSRGRSEASVLRRGAPGVYDLDDGLPWDDGRLPGHQRLGARVFPRSLIARRAAQAADRIIVGNDLLADWAGQHCRDVRVVPTCVEPNDYQVRTAWRIDDKPPVIGWIGSPATERYLLDIAPALAEVHRRSGARLVVVSGAGSVPRALVPFADKFEWSSHSDRQIAEWDVGIMPLRDGVYERAKCGYKLLQYAASGVPAVASPVGVNAGLLAAMDGLAPATHDAWVDALLAIVSEPATRRAMRAAAGLAVAHDYSYEAWEKAFLDSVGWDRR